MWDFLNIKTERCLSVASFVKCSGKLIAGLQVRTFLVSSLVPFLLFHDRRNEQRTTTTDRQFLHHRGIFVLLLG